MRTLKTALVVVGLLAVLYGAYVVINRPGTLPFAFFNKKAEGEKETDPAAPVVSGPGDSEVKGAGFEEPVDKPGEKGTSPGAKPLPPSAQFDPLPPRPFAGPNEGPAPPNPNEAPPLAAPPLNSVADANPPRGGLIPTPRPDRASQPRSLGAAAFQEAWSEARAHLEKGHYPDALRKLTPFYNSSDLNPTDRQQLADLLDRLAGTVIYSKQHHLLARACKVAPGQKLFEIADDHKVPWELLARINNIPDPHLLYPGEELKVVPGPFHVVVNLKDKELVLHVQECYAGRMPISIGNDPPPRDGDFNVVRRIAAEDQANPAGPTPAIDLGGGMTIFGDNGTGNTRGSIAVSSRDATDLYFILTERKSTVVVRK